MGDVMKRNYEKNYDILPSLKGNDPREILKEMTYYLRPLDDFELIYRQKVGDMSDVKKVKL